MTYTFKGELNNLIQEYLADTKSKGAYLERGHRNYVKSTVGSGHLRKTDAKFLYANNGFARIKLAEAMFAEVKTLARRLGDKSILQVTLTPRQYTLGELQTDHFDPASFKRLISRYFGTVNMLGMIEAGYYPRLSDKMGSRGTVSFHAHVIAWGIDHVGLRDLAVRFKERHPSLFLKRPSAYIQIVPRQDVPHVLWYHHKPPTHGYEVLGAAFEVTDPATGEIVCWLDHRSNSRKRALRPGERIRIDNAIGNLLADQLIVATGEEGRAMAKAIKRNILEDYHQTIRR